MSIRIQLVVPLAALALPAPTFSLWALAVSLRRRGYRC